MSRITIRAFITIDVEPDDDDKPLTAIAIFGGPLMAVITRLDLLEGNTQHITVKDQAGRVLPASVVSFTSDTALADNLPVVADPDGPGFIVSALSAGPDAELSGVLTVTATRGLTTVSVPLPATISAALTAITIESP